ncbi:MAG: dihydroorotase [Mycoplasmataceae bacterium]|jgi:dihydroorotase|nr:dihydroorotase [Mycoplasmataceae bacterium]
MKTLIKSGTVFYQDQLQKLDILIDKNKITKISSYINEEVDQTINAKGLTILPGLIDVHTHLREPGFTHKETIKTGTQAAARGGFTTVCCMPNLHPIPDSIAHLNVLNKIIKKDAIVEVLPYAAITINEAGKKIVDIPALAKEVFAFSDDGKGIQTPTLMKQAMTTAQEMKKVIVAHCEDTNLSKHGVVNDSLYAKQHNLLPISNASEYQQIERDIALAKETHAHYHICHISTKEGIALVRKAKRNKLPISCEVTPHHLLLNDTMLKDNGAFKMAPPLRSKDDQQALITALKDNTIDLIVTDHAPHSASEKNRGLKNSAFGIVGLETSFPLMYTHFVRTNQITLQRLIDLMCYKASHIFSLPNRSIRLGGVANLAIFNLKQKVKINAKNFYSKGKSTPFNGYECYGVTKYTIVNGKIIYEASQHE